MMMKKLAVLSVFVLFFSHSLISISYGDSAEVLPKGRFRLGVDTNWYFPIEKRYDPDGNIEDVDKDYNTALDSSVFPALAVFEGPPFNLPVASVGNSIVDFEYSFQIFEFSLQYGITDKLTAGIMFPYWKAKNHVNATVDTSNATVGKNIVGNTLAPLTVPGTVPLTDEDVQALLGKGLDINGDGTIDIPGYGYERFESWRDNGLSDIEAGFRYQYFKTENWRLAFTGGVRFPTGEVDDPDNLVDYPLGSGAWALLFNFNHDFIGIKNLVLNGTFRYEWYLPDKEKKRVPESADLPITVNREKVDRDLGDLVEFEVSGTYQLLEGFSLWLLYTFGYRMKTDISGDMGFTYESLEDETRGTRHIGIAGLSYSTIPMFRAKRFPLPLTASVYYRNRFAGSGNVLRSDYIGVALAAYF